MNSEFSPDLVTLSGEDGVESEFEILDIIEDGKSIFYVLTPHFADPKVSLNRAFEYYIFEVTDCNGEKNFIEVEDEFTANKILNIFEENYNEFIFGNCE